jgi:hypothetical protein
MARDIEYAEIDEDEIGTDTDFGTIAEDLDAINRYMRQTPLKTPEAFRIKDDFIKWYDGLSFYAKNVANSGTYDIARTRRNQLSLANSTTPEEKAGVVRVITTGITTEEMQGKPRPPVDGATGRVGSQVSKPTVAPTPSTMPTQGQPTANSIASAQVKNYPTIRQGSTDTATVKVWQAIIGVTADGKFGPGTHQATKNWQQQRGLTADGVVGPKTWAVAFPQVKKAEAAAAPFDPAKNKSLGLPDVPKPKTPSTGAKKPAPSVNVKPAETKTAAVKKKAKAATVAAAGMFDVSKWGIKEWALALIGSSAIGGAAYVIQEKTKNKR